MPANTHRERFLDDALEAALDAQRPDSGFYVSAPEIRETVKRLFREADLPELDDERLDLVSCFVEEIVSPLDDP